MTYIKKIIPMALFSAFLFASFTAGARTYTLNIINHSPYPLKVTVRGGTFPWAKCNAGFRYVSPYRGTQPGTKSITINTLTEKNSCKEKVRLYAAGAGTYNRFACQTAPSYSTTGTLYVWSDSVAGIACGKKLASGIK